MGKAKSDAPSLERGLDLLDALAKSGARGARPLELERRLKIPRSSLYRLLNILATKGFAFQDDESGRFFLSSECLALGYAARLARPVAARVQSVLRDVVRETRHMAEFAIPAGAWQLMMYETWETASTPLRILSRPGLCFRLDHLCAHGSCFLAFDGQRRLSEYLNFLAARDKRFADVCRETPKRIQQFATQWLEDGYAWEKRNNRGNARIAVPVFHANRTPPRVAGTLGIVCGHDELRQPEVPRLARVLQHHALRLVGT